MNTRVKVTGSNTDLELDKNISLLKKANEELLKRTVESQEGKGSKFGFSVPLHSGAS